jgi:hypothetical protein
VFEVEDPQNFDDRVALKLLKPDAAAGADLERFKREVMSQRLIKHPNMITVYEWGEDQATGCPFYVMDLMRRGTLADVRVSLRPDPGATVSSELVVDVSRACKYVIGALSALEAVHAREIVHRDIKPQNIFLDEAGIAKLGDLGIAKRSDDPGLTHQGYAPGTVLYMSPEQMMGEPLGPESDLFSMGLVLYRVLCGRTVYEEVKDLDTTNSNAVQRHLWELQGRGQDFALEFPRAIPEPLRAVVRRACHIRAAERYRSAREMGNALKEAIRIPVDTRAEQRPFPWAWVVAAGIVAVVGIGSWIGYDRWQDSKVQARIEAGRVVRLRAADARTAVESAAGAEASALLAEADRLMADASEDLVDAEVFLDAGSRKGAYDRLAAAEKTFAQACDVLSERYLLRAADSAAQRALGAAAGLDPIAEQLQPERWAELQRARERLASPPALAGCARPAALVERISESKGIESQVMELRDLVIDNLPKVVERVLTAAVAAGDAARAADLDFPPYREALAAAELGMEQARKALAQAESSQRGEDFLAAEAAAKSAETAFASAKGAAEAYSARGEARRLEQEVGGTGIGIGLLRNTFEAAESAFAAKDWTVSRARFADVSAELGTLLARSEPVRALQKQADDARAAALRAGAAGEPLAAADEKYNGARGQLRSRQFSEAEGGFSEAVGLYERAARGAAELGQAIDVARRQISAARGLEHELRSVRGAGGEFDAALAAGRERLARAESALDSGRYEQVREHAGAADEKFREAKLIVPATRAKADAEALIAKAKQQGLGEALWDLDQRAAQETYAGSAWEQAARDYAQLRARVAEMLAQAEPVLGVRARAERERTRAGARGAAANDLREGDREREAAQQELKRLNVEDARRGFAAAGDLYAAYQPERPAPAQGSRPAPAVPEPPAPERVRISETPSAPTKPSLQSSVERHLEEYRGAYERKDLGALRQLVVLDETQIEGVEAVFWDCPDLRVELQPGPVRIQGERATLDFVQIHRGCLLTDGSQSRYHAKLWQRSGGDWKMELVPADK